MLKVGIQTTPRMTMEVLIREKMNEQWSNQGKLHEEGRTELMLFIR